jgi:E3 ubiquitin-protein ligase UBR7
VGADDDVEIEVEAGAKRSRAALEDGELVSKRMKLDEANVGNGTCSSTPPCLAPNPSQEIQSLLESVEKGDYELFAGDLFLTDDFRDRWCKCSSVRPTTRYPSRTVLERDSFSSVRSL